MAAGQSPLWTHEPRKASIIWEASAPAARPVVAPADGDDQILLCRSACRSSASPLRRRHVDRAGILAARLVVGAQHRSALPDGVGPKPGSPAMSSVFVTSVPTRRAGRCAGWSVPSAPDDCGSVRRLAMRHLPADVARVEINRADAAVWRLDQRQPLNRRALSTAPPASAPWPNPTRRTACGADQHRALVVADIGRRARRRRNEPERRDLALRLDVEDVRLRIVGAAWPVGGGRLTAPSSSVPIGPSAWLTTGGVKIGPILYCAIALTASARSSGVKSIRSSIGQALAVVGRRPGWEGLRRRIPLARHVALAAPAAPRSARPADRSRDRSTYRNACLVGCATALIVRPLTVMSARIGAHGMSMSQMPWCTSW